MYYFFKFSNFYHPKSENFTKVSNLKVSGLLTVTYLYFIMHYDYINNILYVQN